MERWNGISKQGGGALPGTGPLLDFSARPFEVLLLVVIEHVRQLFSLMILMSVTGIYFYAFEDVWGLLLFENTLSR